MNRVLKILLVVLCFVFISALSSQVKGQVAIRSVGVEGGWYIPSLDFWNDYSRVSTWDEQFSGGLFAKGFLEVALVEPVSIRIGAGYWSQSRQQDGIVWGTETRTDEVQLTLIPVTMDVIAGLEIEDLSPVSLYGGIGWGINFIQMKYTRTPSTSAVISEENSGRDYIGYILAGVNIPIASGFAAAIEGRYVFGQYVQERWSSPTELANKDVSLSGPQITLALKYMFGE